MSLPEREATADGRSGRGRNSRIQRVNIEAQVDGELAPRVDMVERHLDDAPDAVLVDLVHRERLDAVLAQDALLARVDVAQADVHDALGRQDGLDPAELWDGLAEPEEEGDGHAVDVPGLGRFGSIDVGVGVDPDDAGVGVLSVRSQWLAPVSAFGAA